MKQIATRLTALLLALVMTTTLALAANKSGYSDVPDKNWASQSIAQCKQYNLLQGIGGGKFGLGQKMTRAAYAAALCRLTGWKTVTPEKGSYTDNQNAKKWYYSAIETASAHDVFSGHSTTCRPNDPITREEMAAMTVRALGYSTLSGTVQDECPFTDVSTNPGYITLAWRMGLVVGMNLTTFAPKNDTTREQAAAVLLRAYHGLKAKVSVTSVSAAPSGAVPAGSLTGTSGAVPLSPRAAVEQVYDAAVKAGKGGSVVINAVPAAQSVKSGKVGALRELTQDELSAYLNDSTVQKAHSNRFDSSYLLCKEKDGSTIVVWYESEANIAEKTELCALLGIGGLVRSVYVVELAMPVMTQTVVAAAEYGADEQLAAQGAALVDTAMQGLLGAVAGWLGPDTTLYMANSFAGSHAAVADGSAAIAVIGGADGPTAIFVTSAYDAQAMWGLAVKVFSNVLVILLNYVFSKLIIFKNRK